MKRIRARLVAPAILLALLAGNAFAQNITGDCNGDGRVSINELLLGVNIALGRAATTTCEAFDTSGDGAVQVNELVEGVHAAVMSVSASTPTPTVSPTQTPISSTASPSPVRTCAATGVATGMTPGSTLGQGNSSAGAPCNWGGGNDAPDVVYEYVAPQAGSYAIRILNASFDPLLWVKTGDCTGKPLACAYDMTGGRAPEADMGLAAGQRIAVIVDGADTGSGPFMLDIERRQPDLAVTALTAPDEAVARDQVLVSADIENQGDGDAGPFDVQFVYTRDADHQQPILVSVLSCTFAGLPALQTVTCGNRPIEVPIVAAGGYFLTAIVHAQEKGSERREDNNTRTMPVAIRARGVELEHLLFRASDGTPYQVISAVPAARLTDAESYWVTTLAGSQVGLDDRKGVGNVVGDPVCALSGGDEGLIPPQDLHPLTNTLRTAIVQPSNSTLVRFDPRASGKVVLGGDTGAVDICIDPRDCPGGVSEALVGINESTDGVPIGCVANNINAPCVPGTRSTVAFGVDETNNVCNRDQSPTTGTTICGQRPLDGFGLRPGQSIVFVFGPKGQLGGTGFTTGVAGFAIDEDGINTVECVANGVLLPFAETDSLPSAPFTPTPTLTPPPCALAGNPTCTATATSTPPTTPTGQIQINMSTDDSVRSPAIAVAPEGEFVAVWDGVADGDGRGVFGQRFGSGGERLGSEFQVNTYITGFQTHESIAFGLNGEFVVVWDSYNQDGSGAGVFAQRFQSDGNRLGTEFQINSYTLGDQNFSALAEEPLGGFIVVWDDTRQSGNEHAVFGQRFACDGGRLGTEFQVNSASITFVSAPAVATDAMGNFIVVWQGVEGTVAQRFGSDGEKLGAELPVNAGDSASPAVAADDPGNFVVVWDDYRQRQITGQRFRSDGEPYSTTFQVGSTSSTPAAVASDQAGNFIVVWEDITQRGSVVFARRYTSIGDAVGPALEIGPGLYFSSDPAVGMDSTGNAVVVWAGPGGILGRRLE